MQFLIPLAGLAIGIALGSFMSLSREERLRRASISVFAAVIVGSLFFLGSSEQLNNLSQLILWMATGFLLSSFVGNIYVRRR